MGEPDLIKVISGYIVNKSVSGDRSLLDIMPQHMGLVYEVEVSPTTWEDAPIHDGSGEPEAFSLSIYHHQNESGQTLFGFTSQVERNLFALLLKLQGVGPVMAMALMKIPMPELVAAIIHQNPAGLKKAKGVGLKTAERICLEAKTKLPAFAKEQGIIVEEESDEGPTLNEDIAMEVFACLSAMGHNTSEIHAAIAFVATLGEISPEEAVTAGLRFLSRS